MDEKPLLLRFESQPLIASGTLRDHYFQLSVQQKFFDRLSIQASKVKDRIARPANNYFNTGAHMQVSQPLVSTAVANKKQTDHNNAKVGSNKSGSAAELNTSGLSPPVANTSEQLPTDLTEEELAEQFNALMDDLNIKDALRVKMMQLPPVRKYNLILQNQQNVSVLGGLASQGSPTSASSQQGDSATVSDGTPGNATSPISPSSSTGKGNSASTGNLLSDGSTSSAGPGGGKRILGNLLGKNDKNANKSVLYYIDKLNNR